MKRPVTAVTAVRYYDLIKWAFFSRRDVPNEWLPCRPLCFLKNKINPNLFDKNTLGSRAKIKPRNFTLIPSAMQGF